MPTLGIKVNATLSTDKTRQTLDDFYRGFKVEAVQVLPYAYLSDKGSRVYNVENSSFFLFIGDVYDGSDPFDIVLTNTSDEVITLQQVNFLMLNATNLKTVEIQSSVEDRIGYKAYFG